jgi:DNA-binding XRE family transcriptional regulator
MKNSHRQNMSKTELRQLSGISTNILANIKVQRINSGLAQTELAYILDVSVEDIENIEEGNGHCE